jgi:hypothetical protein
MFHDLKDAFSKMMIACSHATDSRGSSISFPEELFDRFEQEYKICFVEEEDDVAFQGWQDEYEGDDDEQPV